MIIFYIKILFKVPVDFLILLLVQFLIIIIDRAFYLRRNVRGKLFFQFFQIIIVHIWLFFILPDITQMYVHLNHLFVLKE